MLYARTENELSTIQPILPNKPRGIPRVDDGAAEGAVEDGDTR